MDVITFSHPSLWGTLSSALAAASLSRQQCRVPRAPVWYVWRWNHINFWMSPYLSKLNRHNTEMQNIAAKNPKKKKKGSCAPTYNPWHKMSSPEPVTLVLVFLTLIWISHQRREEKKNPPFIISGILPMYSSLSLSLSLSLPLSLPWADTGGKKYSFITHRLDYRKALFSFFSGTKDASQFLSLSVAALGCVSAWKHSPQTELTVGEKWKKLWYKLLIVHFDWYGSASVLLNILPLPRYCGIRSRNICRHRALTGHTVFVNNKIKHVEVQNLYKEPSLTCAILRSGFKCGYFSESLSWLNCAKRAR